MNVRNKNSIRNSKKDLNSSNKHRQSNDKGGSYLWNGIVQGRRENHRQMVPLLALAAILVYMTFHSITTVSLWTSSPLRISKEPDSGQPPLKSISSLPPSYELWDHRTSTIQFPFNSNYRLEPDKPTSLELLQQVLQGSTTVDIIAEDRSAQQQQQQQQRPSHQSSQVSCYEPNIAATRSLAERVEQERRKVRKRQQKLQQQANESSTVRIRTTQTIIVPPLSFPILNVGMPKSGSSTLRDFFRKQLHWGENTTHYEVNTQRNTTTTMYIGQEMVRAIRDGHTDPFYYIPNHYQIHTQMDYTGPTMNIFPQIQLLDEIHTSHPHATFILLFRPVQDWIQSTQSWHKYPFRWANGGPQNDIPGLLLTPEQRIARDGRGEKIVFTKEQLADWWCDHVHHVRSFVMAYPTHSLIELSLADTDGATTQLLKSIFDLGRKDPDNLGRGGRDDDEDVDKDKDDETTAIWGTSNYNPSNKRSFLGAIHQPIKYYELWNHTTHSMPQTSSSDITSNDSHHIPTSLEILERVMHEEQDQDGRQKRNIIMNEEMTAESTADCFRPRNNNNDIKVMDDPLTATTTTTNYNNNGMNISYPILHVGMPLVGNTFLERYFRDCIIGGRIHVTSKKLKGIGLVGKKMMEAVHAGLPPINGYFGLPDGNDGHAFTQLEYTSVLPNTGSSIYEKVSDKERDYSSFPQIQLLDEIHEDVPYSTFILLFRGNNQTKKNNIDHDRGRRRRRMLGLPNDDATGDDEARSEHPRHELEDWIYLAQNYHNFTERWAAMDDIPGLVLTKEQKEARMVLRTERVEQQQQYEEKNNEGGRTTTTAPTPSSAISLPLQPPMERLSDGQLKDWWCRHIRHVRKFVEFYPTHRLLELDLTDEEATYNMLLHWFPQTNATCLSELWKTTDFL